MLLLCPQVCSSVYIHGFWLASVRTGVSVHHHWCNDCHGVYCSVNPRCWIWKLERWTYRGMCFRRSAFTFKHRSKDKNVQRVSRMMYFSSCILLQHVYIYIYIPPTCELVTWCPIFYICNARSFPQSSASGVAVLSWCNMARKVFFPLCGWN